MSATGAPAGSGAVGSGKFTFKDTQSQKVEGTLGVSGNADFSIEFVKLAFSINASITVGKETSQETSQEINFNIYSGYNTYIYYGFGVEERSGDFDYYDVQGFNSVRPWSARVPQIWPGGDGVIRFVVHYEKI